VPTERPDSRAGSLQGQVARNIRNDIEAGVLRHGHALPSTRELARRWGVSVFTINEAMKALGAEGLILTKDRSSRIINAPDQPDGPVVRRRHPSVLLIGGYAGSGKSELGRIVARQTYWPILDKDTTTRPVVEHGLEVLGLPSYDRESDAYLREIRPREYEAVLDAATENVECGLSVIVTAPFIREMNDESWIARTRARYEALGASASLVWVRCDLDTMRTYLRHRGAARDIAKLTNWSTYSATLDSEFRPPFEHFLIDNSASSEPLQSQARRLLAAVATDAEPG
jgi:predicted kinase